MAKFKRLVKIYDDTIVAEVEGDPARFPATLVEGVIELFSPCKVMLSQTGYVLVPWVFGSEIDTVVTVECHKITTHAQPSNGLENYYNMYVERMKEIREEEQKQQQANTALQQVASETTLLH